MPSWPKEKPGPVRRARQLQRVAKLSAVDCLDWSEPEYWEALEWRRREDKLDLARGGPWMERGIALGGDRSFSPVFSGVLGSLPDLDIRLGRASGEGKASGLGWTGV